MFNKILPVSDIQHLSKSYFLLKVDIGKVAGVIKAGQFFELKSHAFTSTALRKPISIFNVEATQVSFLIKRVGTGTELLSKLQPNAEIDLLGPLGNSFPVGNYDNAVLVSGGIGYPPLFFLKKQLIQAGKSTYFLHGGQAAADAFEADELWTDDGSAGNKGFVTVGLANLLSRNKPDVIYACGPHAMLKTCQQIASEHDVPLYVSLEEYMACGIGVCHGCAVKVKGTNAIGTTYKTVCKDGPVFSADEVDWEQS